MPKTLAELKPGDEVTVRLENGYTSSGIVERIYKNGAVGVREHSTGRFKSRKLRDGRDAYHVRGRHQVTLAAAVRSAKEQT